MSTNLSPAQKIEQTLIRATWEAHEAERQRQLEALREQSNQIKHGTITGYRHHKCRCDRCRQANTDYMREYNRRKRAESPLPEKPAPKGRAGRVVKDHMHGTLTGYSYGCRCDRCTTAHRVARPKSTRKHGTQYAYRHQKCRCRKCVKAESQRVMERRKRKKQA